jgi:hypothetical protein
LSQISGHPSEIILEQTEGKWIDGMLVGRTGTEGALGMLGLRSTIN